MDPDGDRLSHAPARPARSVLQQIKVRHPYYYREMFIPQATSGPGTATWSPDGRELVYSMQGTLWRQRVGSDERRQLTDGPGYDYQPDWSPDGHRIVYASYRNDAIELRLLDLTTGSSMPLLANGAVNLEPRWSPDGRRLAFMSTLYQGRWHLFTAEVTDAGSRRSGHQNQRRPGQRTSPVLLQHRGSVFLAGVVTRRSELSGVSNRGHIWGSGTIWRMPAARPVARRRGRFATRRRPGRRAPTGAATASAWSTASYFGRQWHQLWLMTAEGGNPFQLTYGDFDATVAALVARRPPDRLRLQRRRQHQPLASSRCRAERAASAGPAPRLSLARGPARLTVMTRVGARPGPGLGDRPGRPELRARRRLAARRRRLRPARTPVRVRLLPHRRRARSLTLRPALYTIEVIPGPEYCGSRGGRSDRRRRRHRRSASRSSRLDDLAGRGW